MELVAILNYKKVVKEVGLNCMEQDGVMIEGNTLKICSNKAYLNNVLSIDIYAYASKYFNKLDGSVIMFGNDEVMHTISFRDDESHFDCSRLFNIDLENNIIMQNCTFTSLYKLREVLNEV